MTYKRNIKGILGSSTNQGYIAIYILRMYIYQQVSTLVSTLTPPKCQPLTPTAKVSRMLRRSFWLISSVSDKLIIRTIILCVSNFNSYFGLPYFIAYSSSIRISLVHCSCLSLCFVCAVCGKAGPEAMRRPRAAKNACANEEARRRPARRNAHQSCSPPRAIGITVPKTRPVKLERYSLWIRQPGLFVHFLARQSRVACNSSE